MGKEITVPASAQYLDVVMEFTENEMRLQGCPQNVVFSVSMAVDELFTNIVDYSYPDTEGNATIKIKFIEDPRAIQITFVDSGIPFDPLKKRDPDVTLPLEERPIGGLGVFLVKKYMDNVTYEYEDECNVLTVLKKY